MISKIKISIIYIFVILLFLMIQSSQLVTIGTLHPDFLMILTIIYALSRGSFKGEIFGFVLGTLIDLTKGALFGLNAFIFTLLGALVIPFQKLVKLPNIIVFIFYIIIGTIAKYILYHLFFTLYKDTPLLDFYFFFQIPGEIFINVFFGVILYIIGSRIDTRDDYEWF